MKKNEIIIIADYTQETMLSLEELCQLCESSPEFILDLISYEIIAPHGENQNEWYFSLRHLQRAKTALRLQRDLEMNVPSIAVVLDLLEQIEKLQMQLDFIDRHVLR